ncbi:M6 family metalloprotease domain-containing protein [bacterium]|nr:M6 family metalloprotease domain-containing protein [bacterium]
MKYVLRRWWLVVPISILLPILLLATPPSPEIDYLIRSGQIDEPYAYEHSMDLHNMGVDAPMGVTLGGNLEVYNFNSLVLLADFPDQLSMTAPPFYDNLFFTPNPGTVWDYFQEISYGEFQLFTSDFPSMTGWQTLPQTYAYYTNGQNGFGTYPQNCQKMVEDIVQMVDPLVNFAQYDHDGNGSVDGLVVVHSGTDAAWSGSNWDVWSHAWSLPAPFWTSDGVYVSTYAMVPEFYNVPGDLTPGVICHEMGHSVLGLPDMYDLDYSSYGLGQWSLMAYGMWNGPALMGTFPSHPDAWCRTQCTFGAPENIFEDRPAFISPPTEQVGQYYRMWINGTIGPEYFLVENRQPIGFDSFMPGGGLMIYHVDENVTTLNCNEWYPGYTTNGHYMVALEQGDALFELEQAINMGDGGDNWPGWSGAALFNSGSLPNSLDYNGNNTNVTVGNIILSPPLIIADLLINRPAPVNPLVDVMAMPHFLPIFIPAMGGSFPYDVAINNTLPFARTGHLWFEAILPNGNTYYVNRQTVTLQPGVYWQSLNRNQWVPAMAPPGPYQFVAKVGAYPWFVADYSMFPFAKQALVADGDEVVTSWESEYTEESPTITADWLGEDLLPSEITVSAAWPNPFNAQTSIDITLPAAADLHAVVHNTLGRQVATLADGSYAAGDHRLTLDASELPSGVYFLTISANSTNFTRKLVLLK